jgi:Flp pilus assembly pilin Flp
MLRYLKSERGASAAEYALILAVLGGGVALSTTALSTALRTNISTAAAHTAYAPTGAAVSQTSPPADPPADPTPTAEFGKKKCK